MDTFEIIPTFGVMPFKLGMTRIESRKVIGLPDASFMKGGGAISPVDAYYDGVLQVFFDTNDNIDFIELSSPINAIYKGNPVFETTAEVLIDLLNNEAPYDQDHPELGYIYVFPKLELSLWRPTIPENDQHSDDLEGRFFSTIGIGINGYFSKPEL